MAHHNPDTDLRCPSPPVYTRLDEYTQPDPQTGLSTTHRTTRYDPVLEAISSMSPRKTRYDPVAEAAASPPRTRYNPVEEAPSSERFSGRTAWLQASTSSPASSGVPLYHWRSDQSEPSTSAAVLMGTFQPCERYPAQETEYQNAEAGPSTPAPPQRQGVGVPTSSPGRMIPETTVYAETNQTIEEEDRGLESEDEDSDVVRPGPSKDSQKQHDQRALRCFVKKWKGFRSLPSLNTALTHTLKHIMQLRSPVYQESRLIGKPGERPKERGKVVQERREVERDLYSSLSRYYVVKKPPNSRKKKWGRGALLREVLIDVHVNRPIDFPAR